MFDLFIVESPNKIKKIKRYLTAIGMNCHVLASFGHIRDLEKKSLSIDIDNNFKPKYVVIDNKRQVIRNLKEETLKCVNSGGNVWLASDFDREGESIAWHLCKVLKLNRKSERVKRAIFTEITKNAIKQAVEHPKSLDIRMFYSQQARRILDRLIGYLVSPILWKHFSSSYDKGTSLSAGRVQSVVVKLVKERENEINSFTHTKYYKITGSFDQDKLKANLSTTFPSSKEVKVFLNHCVNAEFTIGSITSRKTTRKPSPPFITSTLQQQASVKYGFSPKKTMMLAQRLYENGLITYMRTDSLALSEDALQSIQNEIEARYGVEYHQRKEYTKKVKNSQEAHEAIRPSAMSKSDLTEMEEMGNDENKLYRLIWKRTIACQMKPAKVNIMTIHITISNREETFIAKGESILFDGFLIVYKPVSIGEDTDESDAENEFKMFASYKSGDTIEYTNLLGIEKITKPPHGHYSEASLIKKLESIGVGRPSTYSSILSIVQDRNYIKRQSKKGNEVILKTYHLLAENDHIKLKRTKQFINSCKNKLFITDTGNLITTFLEKNFERVMDYHFTADIEEMLDNIANGEKKWIDVVSYFYQQFYPKVKELASSIEKEKNKHRRILGRDSSGKEVLVYIGQYGPVACIVNPDNSKKNRYASLQNHKMSKITLAQALKLFEYPKKIGTYQDDDVILYSGRYGFYLKCNGKNYSIKDKNTMFDLNEENVGNFIEGYGNTGSNIIKKVNKNITIIKGKYGPYINYKNKINVSIRGKKDPKEYTFVDCMTLIRTKQGKMPKK